MLLSLWYGVLYTHLLLCYANTDRISLAPEVPDWVKKNDAPTVNVKLVAGMPHLSPEEMQDEKKKQEKYKQLSFGGSVRKF